MFENLVLKMNQALIEICWGNLWKIIFLGYFESISMFNPLLYIDPWAFSDSLLINRYPPIFWNMMQT